MDSNPSLQESADFIDDSCRAFIRGSAEEDVMRLLSVYLEKFNRAYERKEKKQAILLGFAVHGLLKARERETGRPNRPTKETQAGGWSGAPDVKRHAHTVIGDAMEFGAFDKDIRQYVIDAVDFARLTVRDGCDITIPKKSSIKPAQDALKRFHATAKRLEEKGLLY